MNKDIKKILIALFFFALSSGTFYNFEELWMSANGLSTKTIGIVYSICALLTVSTIFLCSNFIDRKKSKKFVCTLLLLKTVIMFFLCLLNNSGYHPIIKFLVMVDYVMEVEIYACIYPLLSYITKNDKIYAMRGLIYSFAYYGGVLLTTLLVGKTISLINFNYNMLRLIAVFLILIAYIILKNINLEKYTNKENGKVDNDIFLKVLNKVKKDKITQNYLGYVLVGEAAYKSITGLLMIILTTSLGFSATGASNLRLILGIASVFIATLILGKLTFKNNYINISIKFISRMIFYIIAIIFNNKFIFLLTIIFVLLLSDSYSHVTDAPYINRFNESEQLAFCNLKEMVHYFSRSIGNLCCGIALTLGIRYNFLFALIFIIIQIYFSFSALRLYNQEKENKQ